MLKVHHLTLSQAERIVWLCEELGIDYELVRWERRTDNNRAPEELAGKHPMRMVPVIEDGGLVLAESGAIFDYILARHGSGGLVPAPGHPDFADHLFWYHFAQATFMSAIATEWMLRLARAGDTKTAALMRERKELCWSAIEERLATTPWFGGSDFTTADIMMVFPLTTMRIHTRETLEGRTHTLAYLTRVAERPAYRRAMALAEPGFAPFIE